MYKKLLLLVLVVLYSLLSFAQPSQYTPMTAQGYQFKRILTDSTLHLPSFCGVPTLRNSTAKNGALAIDTCNYRLYQWSNSGGWRVVSTDTTSLSNRINGKIDSLKRSSDSIFAYKNSQWVFQYKDSTGGGGVTPTLQQVLNEGNTANESGGVNTIQFTNNAGYQSNFTSEGVQSTYDDLYATYYSNGIYLSKGGSVYLSAAGYDNGGYIDISNIYSKTLSLKAETTSGIDPFIQWYDGTNTQKLYPQYSLGSTEIHMPYVNAVDTLATLSDVRNSVIDTANKFVNQIYRTAGIDSIYYKIGATTYAIKDSIGGGPSQNGRFGNDTATIVMAKVHNDAGVTLTNGKVVMFSTSGTSSDAPSVKLANNKGDSTSANTIGFVSGTIAVNDTGWVILSGKIEKLNTSAFANGDIIYLDSISGNWTKTKPQAPYHMVYLGIVVKANAGNGSIFVKVQNGYELEELHNVKISSPLNNQVLSYSDTQSLWKNRNIYSIVDTTNTIATKSNVALKLNISDTASMLLPYLRKIDTTNKFVNNITRTTGKDSIIFYIGGTRYAIKDSVGGGGGSAAGSTGYVQFNNAGSFAADSSLFWDNTNKRLGIGTTTPNSKLNVAAGTLTDLVSAMSLSATMPSVITATNIGVLYDITSAGSSSFAQTGVQTYLNAGYTGSQTTAAFNAINNAAGTGASIFVARNQGAFFSASGTTTGTNVGTYGSGSNGNINYGVFGRAIAAKNSATNIGVAGFGLNVGTSPIQVGGYFGLQNVDPTFTSAALMCDNGSEASDIFVARDNSSPIFKIFDGGNTFIGSSPTNAGYKLDVNGTGRFASNLTVTGYINASSQFINTGNSTPSALTYKLTNAGGASTPKLIMGALAATSGNKRIFYDETNELMFGVANSGGTMIARSAIQVSASNNTAGSETGDMIFLTQSGGTAMSEKMRITSGGGITYTSTNTAAGTTGNQTINKPSGTVNIAAAGTTITVTNSLVTTSSIVFATIRTNDATAVIKNVVPAAGSFTINLNAAATAETSIGFFVIN